jgi:hypothetical protein
MATWKAEVFVNSRVGRINTEVEAATFQGAKEQIYAKHGDVQQIVNLRQVSSGGSSSGSEWRCWRFICTDCCTGCYLGDCRILVDCCTDCCSSFDLLVIPKVL